MSRILTIAVWSAALAALTGCGQAYITGGSSDIYSQPVASDQWGKATQNPMDAPQEWRAAQPAGAKLEPSTQPAPTE